MANWNTLKTAVADVINANGNQAITGQLLQNVLNNIITNVGENATFAGIAALDTNPGAPDGPVFYLTATAGTYPNFNGIEVQDEEAAILLWNNNVWSKKVTGFVTQKKLSELGSKEDLINRNILDSISTNYFGMQVDVVGHFVGNLGETKFNGNIIGSIIDISDFEVLLVQGTVTGQNLSAYAFFNENLNVNNLENTFVTDNIISFGGAIRENSTYEIKESVIVPPNAKYIYIFGDKLNVNTITNISEKLDKTAEEASTNFKFIRSLLTPMLDVHKVVGYYVGNLGETKFNGGIIGSIIDISDFEVLLVQGTVTGQNLSAYAFFNENLNVNNLENTFVTDNIISFGGAIRENSTYEIKESVIVPPNAKYIYIFGNNLNVYAAENVYELRNKVSANYGFIKPLLSAVSNVYRFTGIYIGNTGDIKLNKDIIGGIVDITNYESVLISGVATGQNLSAYAFFNENLNVNDLNNTFVPENIISYGGKVGPFANHEINEVVIVPNGAKYAYIFGDKLNINVAENAKVTEYKNKKIMFIGDSFSAFGAGGDTIMMWQYLQRIWKANVVTPNYNDLPPTASPAKGGIKLIPPINEPSTLNEKSIWYKCTNGVCTGWNADVIFLLGGANDGGMTLGSINDAAYVANVDDIKEDKNITDVRPDVVTYYSALKGCVLMLKAYNPMAEVILWSYSNNLSEDLTTAQLEVANYYGIKFIPVYYEFPKNNMFIADGTHVNSNGGLIQAKCIASYLGL